MQLIIDTVRRTVRDSRFNNLEFDRHYPMPDEEHRFIVRQLNNCMLIEIKKGKRVIQRGKVRHLSATAGQSTSGGSMPQTYKIDLDPSKEIYPIAELVDKVIAMGVAYWQISPMFESYPLSDCVASHSSPHMMCDGEVRRIEHPEAGDLMQSSQFVVKEATWAVRFFGTKISHVYLWMGAAEHADTILDTLKGIKANEAAPVYSA